MTFLSSASYVLLDVEPVSSVESWAVQLNQLCLQGLAPWLADEFGITTAQIEEASRSHATVWPLVDGSAIAADDAIRLILMPSAAIDQSELRVPQEWVDIPDWVGDYYLAVRVNPDSGQLCVWGYTTHIQLKQTARYDADDRSYCLEGEAVTDLAVLSTARALGLAEATRASVASLPELSTAQVDSLVQQLTGALMPRLAVPFVLWGAMVRDARVRSRLVAAAEPANLSQWLSLAGAQLTQGWQTLESLLPAGQSALAFRAGETANAVRGGKRLRLETGPSATATVILLVAVETEADERVSVRVQLRPEPDASLPADVELSLLSPAGEVVQTVTRQPQDDYIQLKRFRLPPGYDFTIQICSGSQTVQEPLTT